MAGKNQVRVAMIGAGSMASRVHYPSLKEIPEAEKVAVCDLDEERARKAAERFGFELVYTDYRRMLDEVKPEAVYVIMAPHLLFDIVVECLERGVHVFVEKPPGITSNQTRAWARLARRHGCLTMVGFNRRFIPLLVQCRNMVQQKGPIHQCMATFIKGQGYPEQLFGASGIILADAIHAVDALRWMGGEVREVHSALNCVGQEFPNSFAALLRFESGGIGHTFEMHAAGISAYVDANTSATITCADSTEPQVITTRQAAGSEEMYKYYGFFDENRHFLDCILKGVEPQTNFADALKTMELCDAIMRGGMARMD